MSSPTAAAASAEAPRTVASAVLRIQMALLDGAAASNEALLHAAASALLSRADYDDVVTERTIADACGNPACPNPLPSAAASATGPRFHIALSEHRVYDLEEARKFCSERCLVASKALAASLPHDRPYGVPLDRLAAVVALVAAAAAGDGSGLGFQGVDGRNEDEGRKVEIKEKEVAGGGEVSLQDWIGPSDAIEGYVPRRDRSAQGQKPQPQQNKVAGPELSRTEIVDSRTAASGEDGMTSSPSLVETHMSAEVIAERMGDLVLGENTTPRKKKNKTPSKMLEQEEDNRMLSSCISDSIAKQLEDVVLEERKGSKKNKVSKASSRTQKSKSRKRPAGSDGHEVDFTSTIIIGDASTNREESAMNQYNYLSSSVLVDNHPSSSQSSAKDSTQAYAEQLCEEFSEAMNIGNDETTDEKMRPALKSSLKVTGSKSGRQSVTWADENGSVLETSKAYESPSSSIKQPEDVIDSSLRRASAEACAAALIEAAEAISSGTVEAEDAVSKAGIIILPDVLNQKEYDNAKNTAGDDDPEIDRDVIKWPKKPVLLDTDMFEVDDSWHDTPPEGFSLTLSAFGTMWAALFGWISRSSLAYVYGLERGSVEELLIANGREYPEKIVLKDGLSSEIRRALDSCVCNAVPVLISNLRMQIPVSKLEITLGYLIDTMSFVDALPSLRSRQWQAVVLVMLDVLSVHQLPALAPVFSNSKLVQKMLNAAQVSREEYDSMVDLFLPFGRSVLAATPM
ncbi:putative RNA polymerase II subunit B1 CTD phosphatase RPAP2 homolog [Miscanthus floridulus]|uniref:putative RNA polymerase II subunit B1 CTD phosphatase RPAP2 homolog n=1 Tax=Miscanthus floridulus TaxID=154761 RepID=UPI00345ADE84